MVTSSGHVTFVVYRFFAHARCLDPGQITDGMASEDPQDQLDEAIKKAERLAEELNQEKDPQAQLDEAINEAKRLAEELNPERENKKKKTNKPPGIRFRWRQRDERGQIVPQNRKATTSTSLETRTSGLESTPVLNIEEIGRYNVTVPVLTCTTCLSTWTANLADLIKNGRWPATVNCDTIYQVDLFSSFEELKVSAPGMSRLAFMRILEQRTDFFGRNGMTFGDTFQKSFFEWMYCRSEIDQVCDIQYFDCPACSPGMLAVSVDGNKKLYRFKKGKNRHANHPGRGVEQKEEKQPAEYCPEDTLRQQQKSRRRPRLSNFKSDLGVGDETLYNWTMEVQQWANTEETNENMDGPQVLQN
ncbi:uncharacterized protein LOC112260117 [Oncorhynchus tshawytscha]|uniref:uncharacterized protein LOC112260117 n=1 Tax=Oncorhynchus tshawytscha TaxID=74940 RepID=UPI001C3D7CDC|nr:uncharacterized protein LOC112260117 [Oncorhynchus tshawytscha]